MPFPIPSLSLKTWLMIGGSVLAAVVVFFVYKKVDNHFDHIKELEKAKVELTQQNTRLNKQLNEAADINNQNKKIYEDRVRQAEQARRVAEQERREAEQRATRYRSIRDAAKNTPTADRRPIDPVVQSTVDRLLDTQR